MKSFSPQAKTLLFAFLLLALFFVYGGLFYPHSADLPSGGSLEEPSSAHWLGTDDLGVDLYAQLSAGFFSSMAVGLAAAAFAFLLGGLAGVLAGLSSGTADAFLSFLIQLFLFAAAASGDGGDRRVFRAERMEHHHDRLALFGRRSPKFCGPG